MIKKHHINLEIKKPLIYENVKLNIIFQLQVTVQYGPFSTLLAQAVIASS